MKTTLTRNSNLNYWLWSTLKVNDNLSFDGLEMGDTNQIPIGLYKLEIVNHPHNGNKYITIINSLNEVCGYFTKRYTETQNNIVMRIFRNDICIGKKKNETTMENLEGAYYQLVNAIEAEISNNKIVSMLVENTVPLQPNK